MATMAITNPAARVPSSAATSKPAAAATTAAMSPVQKIAESFIGQRVGKASFGDFGSSDFHVAGIFGALAGYESLDAAIKLASATAIKNYEVQPTYPFTVSSTNAFLVFKAADRYALMQADNPLLIKGSMHPWRSSGYRTFDSPATSALVAVIDGAGQLVANKGKVRWWN